MHGHDWDTLFACPAIPECSLVQSATRDLMWLHTSSHGYQTRRASVKVFSAFNKCQFYRRCPIPHCPYEVHWTVGGILTQLGLLQSHLLEHETASRRNYESLLATQGYDSVTGSAVCPVCRSTHTDHRIFLVSFVIRPSR
jgi:hypothetical protein